MDKCGEGGNLKFWFGLDTTKCMCYIRISSTFNINSVNILFPKTYFCSQLPLF